MQLQLKKLIFSHKTILKQLTPHQRRDYLLCRIRQLISRKHAEHGSNDRVSTRQNQVRPMHSFKRHSTLHLPEPHLSRPNPLPKPQAPLLESNSSDLDIASQNSELRSLNNRGAVAQFAAYYRNFMSNAHPSLTSESGASQPSSQSQTSKSTASESEPAASQSSSRSSAPKGRRLDYQTPSRYITFGTAGRDAEGIPSYGFEWLHENLSSRQSELE